MIKKRTIMKKIPKEWKNLKLPQKLKIWKTKKRKKWRLDSLPIVKHVLNSCALPKKFKHLIFLLSKTKQVTKLTIYSTKTSKTSKHQHRQKQQNKLPLPLFYVHFGKPLSYYLQWILLTLDIYIINFKCDS